MNDESSRAESDPLLNPTDLRWFLELGCWTIVLLSPMLNWVNGPPVSPDQAVVRTLAFSLALICAIGLRFASLLRSWRRPKP